MDKVELTIVLSFVACFVFGLTFNVFTALSERRGWIEGLISLYVAIGVAMTVLLMGMVIGWENVLILAIAFMCSGTPMIVGSVSRHIVAIQQEAKRIIELSREDKESNKNAHP